MSWLVSQDVLAFATEPLFASLSNVLGRVDNISHASILAEHVRLSEFVTTPFLLSKPQHPHPVALSPLRSPSSCANSSCQSWRSCWASQRYKKKMRDRVLALLCFNRNHLLASSYATRLPSAIATQRSFMGMSRECNSPGGSAVPSHPIPTRLTVFPRQARQYSPHERRALEVGRLQFCYAHAVRNARRRHRRSRRTSYDTLNPNPPLSHA